MVMLMHLNTATSTLMFTCGLKFDLRSNSGLYHVGLEWYTLLVFLRVFLRHFRHLAMPYWWALRRAEHLSTAATLLC